MTKRQNDIERYLRGEMNASEMHALEKEALNDPFLSDALEGAQNNKDHFLFDLRELRSSVRNRTGKQKPKMISMWNWSIGIAAGLILTGMVGVYLISEISNRREEMLAENTAEIDSSAFEKPTPVDTLEIVMPGVTSGIASRAPERIRRVERVVPAETISREAEREAETNFVDADSTAIASETASEEIITRSTAPALSINPRVIRGVVTSAEDGSVLPGVNVIVKGTNIGTITDSEGHYEITLSQPGQKLEFNFIGVKPVEAETRNKSNVNIALVPDYESLSEVVVTGYGVQEAGQQTYNLAQPQGGRDAYSKYLEQKLVYPEQALKNEVEGRVTIQFTVDDKGSLSNFKVLNSLGFGCDDEAIRLIREGPAWFPSKKNDKPVAEQVKVSLKFDKPNP